MVTNQDPSQTPEFVEEVTSARTPRVFQRNELGNYAPISRLLFKSLLRARLKSRGRSTTPISWKHANEVRCVAGLAPGLHQEGAITFLNPQCVRLIPAREPSPPPAAFTRLGSRRAELLAADRGEDERAALCEEMIELFERDRGVKRVPRGDAPWSLLGLPWDGKGFPGDDHCALFEGRGGLLWTAHPYGLNPQSWPQMLGFARFHGLTVTISERWSWYYPGRSVLIEWREDPRRRSSGA